MNLSVIRRNPLSIPMIMAETMGLYKKYNVNVNMEIVEDFTFDGGNPFVTGKSHSMIGDTTFFFYALKRGKKAVITSDLTRTISLIGRPNALEKKKIRAGVNRAGLFRLFLENDLKHIADRVEIVWINNTYERIEAFKNNEIDVLVAIEPFVSDVKELGGEILWSLRESDKNLVMWAFDEEYYNNNKEEVANFYKAIIEAQEIFNNGSAEERVRLAKDFAGYNEKDAERVKNFTFEKYKKYNKDDFDLCKEWMQRAGEIEEIYDGDKLIVSMKETE